MIEVKNLTKTFKKQRILDCVNLEVADGSTVGIVGNNGSGKTVLFKCILGIYLPNDGEVWVNGKRRSKKDGILTEASAMIEHPAFLENYSGMHNLRCLYELNHKKDVAYIKEIMETVGLGSVGRKKVKRYSLGMRQRLAIAQVVMDDNDILILDEPFNGLDHHGVEEMRKLFLDLKEQGKTILLASHNREDIDILCDRVYEMDAGKLA